MGYTDFMECSQTVQRKHSLLEAGDVVGVLEKLERSCWMRNIKNVARNLANIVTSAEIVVVVLK